MLNRNKLSIVLLLALCLIGTSAISAKAAPVDYTIYAELLQKYVQAGVVDYAGFQKDEARLDEFLAVLEKVDIESLNRDEQMAFYINVYNAWTIKLILSEYPEIDSIRDIGGIFTNPWKKEIVRIGGEVMHLDNVEHDILRPKYKDARIHFAINCAAKSCPPLISEPYTGAKLQNQLQENTVKFLNDPKWTYLEGEDLYVTRIFKWFSEDFYDGDIVRYVKEFAQGEFKAKLDALGDEVDLNYMHYDWALNGK